jgi:hypothetical protein
MPQPPGAAPAFITANNTQALTALGLSGDAARNAALYFPRVIESDPNRQDQLDTFVPCGAWLASWHAQTDSGGLEGAGRHRRGLNGVQAWR